MAVNKNQRRLERQHIDVTNADHVLLTGRTEFNEFGLILTESLS